ncbi:MAG: hypothetical protein AAF802_30140, partial [Planctomycetota bacterium]
SDAIGLASSLETVAVAAAGVGVDADFGSGLSTSGRTSGVTVSVTPDRRGSIGTVASVTRTNETNDAVFLDWTPSELTSINKLSSFRPQPNDGPDQSSVAEVTESTQDADRQLAPIDDLFTTDQALI